MQTILMALLKKIGWKRLLGMVWKAVKPMADKAAAKTSTSFDNDCISVLDEMIDVIVNDKAA